MNKKIKDSVLKITELPEFEQIGRKFLAVDNFSISALKNACTHYNSLHSVSNLELTIPFKKPKAALR